MKSNIWLSLLVVCGLLLALTGSVGAQAPSGLPQYFVPFDDTNLWQLFTGVNRCHRPDFGDVSSTLESVISLTASADGTQWFYDHWEDSYDPDPASPGTTTTSGMLNAGESMIWRDQVITPRDSNQECEPGRFCYDGRDRIALIGEPAAVARMVFPSIVEGGSGVVLATAWEVPEVRQWNTNYIATIGEDLDFNGNFVDDFDYAGLEVMAAYPGTQVYYNGIPVGPLLGPGQTFFLPGANDGEGGGGVNSYDAITASHPIQVQSFVGGCNMSVGWSSQGYTLEPVTDWDNTYWAPVPDFADSDGVEGDCNIDLDGSDDDDRDVDIYIHNPHDADITVTLNILGSSYNGTLIPVPAHTTESVLGSTDWNDLPPDTDNTQAIQLVSTETFWAVSMVDSSTAGDNEPRVNDWGYSLIPQRELSSAFVIGWGLGNNATPPSNNANLAFVTAVTDTRIYVDLNQDGTPDAFDMNGDGDAADSDVYNLATFDEPDSANGILLVTGQVLRVGDPNDRSMGGALIYTTDLSQKIAVAWGQDACAADRADPYIDLGYTPLAVVIPVTSKEADAGNGISPGDALDYTVTLKNNGYGPMFNAVLTDDFPDEWVDLVLGSIQTTLPCQDPPGIEYDDGTGTWVYFPTGAPGDTDANIQKFRLTWNTIEAQETLTVTFRVILEYGITVPEICNFAQTTGDNTNPVDINICNEVSPVQAPTLTPTATPTATGTPSTPTPTPTATTTPINGNGHDIPEPPTFLLMGVGLAALAGYAARHLRRR